MSGREISRAAHVVVNVSWVVGIFLGGIGSFAIKFLIPTREYGCA
jgi:hypothetical protein